MTTKLLSRAKLRRDVPAAALRAVLVPEGEGARAATSHRLVWTLFADAPQSERDFLWREHGPGLFYLLSNRVPHDPHGLFDLEPAKEFTPSLSVGARLAFEIRVNATVSRGGAPGVRGKPCDIVMDAIHACAAGERADARREALDRVSRAWMTRQGERSGFALEKLAVLGYSALDLERDRQRTTARLGVLDLRGELSVQNPSMFVAAVGTGFGRAKAFGCGLMMVRRA